MNHGTGVYRREIAGRVQEINVLRDRRGSRHGIGFEKIVKETMISFVLRFALI
jgi:hypothetical protein